MHFCRKLGMYTKDWANQKYFLDDQDVSRAQHEHSRDNVMKELFFG